MTSRLNGFLSGTRVIDLSRHLPGPLATLLMADMGAEVIKVESPAGDEMRSIGPVGPNGRSVLFDTVNAGKRSLRLDLKTPAGKDELLALVRSADVLVESFRPGVMARLGVGAEVLRAAHPGLIVVSMSGYGQSGPMRDAAGHDANYLALGGVLAASGSARHPSYLHPPMADCTASIFALSSVLGALLARTRDGKGCVIDLALADVMMPFQLFSLASLGLTGQAPGAEEGLLNGGWACYRPYPLRDGGVVALGAVEPHFWRTFCNVSSHPEWIDRHQDALPQAALIGLVEAHFAALSRTECESLYAAADCCVTVVRHLGEAVRSEHFVQRGLVRRHPSMGIFEAGYPVLVDGEAPELRMPLQDDPASASISAGKA
jgi:alpha-methylacyl-CoA racemase